MPLASAGHRVRLDQRLLGVGGVPLVEVAHRVGHALEAGACEGQAAQGFAGGVGLSGGALLEQEGHGAARPRQPPLADDAGPQAHGIDGPGAAVSRLSVDGALDDDLARAGVVGGRVSPDARVHDAVDEDGGRVEVEGAEQNLMGPALDGRGVVCQLLLDGGVVDVGLGGEAFEPGVEAAQKEDELVSDGLEFIGDFEDDLHRGAPGEGGWCGNPALARSAPHFNPSGQHRAVPSSCRAQHERQTLHSPSPGGESRWR